MSLDAALARFAADHHGVFATSHAQVLGLTRKQIHVRRKQGLWLPVHDGAYRLEGVPLTWKSRLLAACWAGGFRALASHRSAAALYGLAGGRRSIAEITCPRWRRARHTGLQVHESQGLGALDSTVIDGIPVTTPEVTLLMLGAVCDVSIVELALDRAQSTGLVSPMSLQATLKRLARRGRNGAGVLRELLEARSPVRATPESEMETRLLQLLRRGGFPDPSPQYEIRHTGSFVARVDAAYPQWKVALEYDSYEWHSDRAARDRDAVRRLRIQSAGWAPVSVTAATFRDASPLFAAIRAARDRSCAA